MQKPDYSSLDAYKKSIGSGTAVTQDIKKAQEQGITLGPAAEKTVEEYMEKYGGWEEDRKEAAEIRAKAIAAGAWGKPKETEAVETVAVPVAETPATVSSLPVDNIICSAVGFVVGAVAVTIYFRMKMNQLKRDCETRVNEARTALDRMLKIASGD